MTLVETSVHTDTGGAACFEIHLAAPRANALEPGLLDALETAFDDLASSGVQRAVITGGHNFSTGGDVARFLAAAERGEAAAYTRSVVPVLQRCVLRMISMPVIFAAAARGATTGGSAGFLFAADWVVLAPDAFLQPYYATVGFAPDGGWTALLPDRIGLGPTTRILLDDTRLTAADALAAGIAAAVSPTPEQAARDHLSALDLAMALETKALLWDVDRRAAVQNRLDAETRAFLRRIVEPDTRTRMARFLGASTEAAHV